MWPIHQQKPPNEPYIWIKNVFTDEEIARIIEIGKSKPSVDGGVENKDQDAQWARRSKISWIGPDASTVFIFERLTDAITKVNKAFYDYELTQIEDLQFSEYDESYQGMYRNHTDDGYDSNHYRKLSFTLQLSDPSDYEGGDLNIYRFKLDEPMVVKKEKGMLAAFPSWSIHEVTPVTKGTRYTLVGWVHGPKFR